MRDQLFHISSRSHHASASKSTGDKKVLAKAIPMDFSKLEDSAQWQNLQTEIAGLDIGVLSEYMLPVHL